MDVPVLGDQQGLIYITFVRTQDVERWIIGTDWEKESGKYVLSKRLYDDDKWINQLIIAFPFL